jgi:ABC-type enterochelin transport system permease subunit
MPLNPAYFAIITLDAEFSFHNGLTYNRIEKNAINIFSILGNNHRVVVAVTCTRLPQIVACGFPALRSSDIDSQHRE